MTPESILEFEAACQKTLAEMKESRSTFPDNSWTDGFFQGANSYHSHLLGVLATLRDSKEVKVCSDDALNCPACGTSLSAAPVEGEAG